MTQIVGKIVDSGGVAIAGELVVTLDAPLIDTSTSPDQLYLADSHTFSITAGLLSGVSVVESQSKNVTYHFQINRYETLTTYWLADGTQYSGPFILHTDSNYYTGTFYDAATSQRLGKVDTQNPVNVLDFHAVVPNVASVEFASLIPTRISTDSLPTTIRQVAELLTSDPDFVEALRGGPRFKGNYASGTYYQRDDSVNYGGSSWVYINADPATGQTPSLTNITYWQILAQKGDPGGIGGNDTAYNSTGWDGATDAPSRNAVRDIIETLVRTSQLTAYAPLANPALTDPTATTQSTGNRSNRVATTDFVGNEINLLGIVPIGAMMDWITASAPSKWLLCDGRAISRTTYSVLFAVIGIAFGSGNGTTTFNIPDCRGRVAVAPDDMGTTSGSALRITTGASTLAGSGGSDRVTLTTNQMPAHNHPPASGTSPSFANIVASGGTAAVGTGSNILTNTTTGNTGGGASHENMMPYVVLNKIIYAGI